MVFVMHPYVCMKKGLFIVNYYLTADRAQKPHHSPDSNHSALTHLGWLCICCVCSNIIVWCFKT